MKIETKYDVGDRIRISRIGKRKIVLISIDVRKEIKTVYGYNTIYSHIELIDEKDILGKGE